MGFPWRGTAVDSKANRGWQHWMKCTVPDHFLSLQGEDHADYSPQQDEENAVELSLGD